MKMDMKDGLSGIPTIVDDHTVSAALKSPFLGKILRNIEEVSYHLSIIPLHTMDISDVFFGNYQNMRRRLRIDIHEGNGKIVLMYELCRNLFLDNLAKDAFLFTDHAAPYLSK